MGVYTEIQLILLVIIIYDIYPVMKGVLYGRRFIGIGVEDCRGSVKEDQSTRVKSASRRWFIASAIRSDSLIPAVG